MDKCIEEPTMKKLVGLNTTDLRLYHLFLHTKVLSVFQISETLLDIIKY